ncbi:MAG TPA: hypothetical protein VE641_14435 [Chthoniobacterales bacterium]|jgi:hypothetical protein|nr:hypothetical protein [Chthoniobacterales bacterium]
MFTITYSFAPAHPLLRPEPAERPLPEQKEPTDRAVEPETRLWKITAEAVQPKKFKGELLVLVVFLAIVASATVESVQELSRLMRTDAIEQVAARALQSSR